MKKIFLFQDNGSRDEPLSIRQVAVCLHHKFIFILLYYAHKSYGRVKYDTLLCCHFVLAYIRVAGVMHYPRDPHAQSSTHHHSPF